MGRGEEGPHPICRPHVSAQNQMLGSTRSTFSHTFSDTFLPHKLTLPLHDRRGHSDYVRDIIGCGAHLFTVSDDCSMGVWDPARLLGAAERSAPSAFQAARRALEKVSCPVGGGRAVLGVRNA